MVAWKDGADAGCWSWSVFGRAAALGARSSSGFVRQGSHRAVVCPGDEALTLIDVNVWTGRMDRVDVYFGW